MPRAYQVAVKLLPFYHSTKGKHKFQVATSDYEAIVNADLNKITFYKEGNDRLVIDDQPLVVRFNDQQNVTLHFLQSNDMLQSDQLQEVSKLVINLDEVLQDIYQANVQEYELGNKTIYHNHGTTPNRIGYIVIERS